MGLTGVKLTLSCFFVCNDRKLSTYFRIVLKVGGSCVTRRCSPKYASTSLLKALWWNLDRIMKSWVDICVPWADLLETHGVLVGEANHLVADHCARYFDQPWSRKTELTSVANNCTCKNLECFSKIDFIWTKLKTEKRLILLWRQAFSWGIRASVVVVVVGGWVRPWHRRRWTIGGR